MTVTIEQLDTATEIDALAEKIYVAYHSGDKAIGHDDLWRFAAHQALLSAAAFVAVRAEWRAGQLPMTRAKP